MPCYSCGHETPHLALGPKDNNGFHHNDKCEECPCINDPTFDWRTGIRHALDDHAFVADGKRTEFCGYPIFGVMPGMRFCSMPKREHLHA